MALKKVLWARMQWGHMGLHSGMSPLPQAVAHDGRCAITFVDSKGNSRAAVALFISKLQRHLGISTSLPDWITRRDCGSPFYSEAMWLLEKRIASILRRHDYDCVFLEGIEDQLSLLAESRKTWASTRLVGVSHQPPAWWRLHHQQPAIVKELDRLIVLASSTMPFWSEFIPPEKLALCPLGVDTTFFRPKDSVIDAATDPQPLRVLFGGRWLRDFRTLAAVIDLCDSRELNVCFDLIIPQDGRSATECYRMAMSTKVRWHSNLSNEQLRNLYQRSDLLLLTLIDSAANTSLLEAMACGLPVIATDVGGVRDYVQEDFADLVGIKNAVEIVNLLAHYATNRHLLRIRGALARQYVVTNTSWDAVLPKYLDAIIGRDSPSLKKTD